MCSLPHLPRHRELVTRLGPIHARLSCENSIARRHPVYKCSEVQVFTNYLAQQIYCFVILSLVSTLASIEVQFTLICMIEEYCICTYKSYIVLLEEYCICTHEEYYIICFYGSFFFFALHSRLT